jgi:hypothetical protein
MKYNLKRFFRQIFEPNMLFLERTNLPDGNQSDLD